MPAKPEVYKFKNTTENYPFIPFDSTSYYELSYGRPYPILDSYFQIKPCRKKAPYSPSFWVQFPWRNALIGLYKTEFPRIYRANHDNRKHLLLFEFKAQDSELFVFVFKNQYSQNISDFVLEANKLDIFLY